MKAVLVLVVCLTLLGGVVHAAPPTLVSSEPTDGARNVPTDVGVLRFCFDREMKQNSWTFWQCDKAEFPPQAGQPDNPWKDARCAELRVGALKPGTTYAVQLNSARNQGFLSASEGEPLPVTVISFTTAGGVDSGEGTGPTGKRDASKSRAGASPKVEAAGSGDGLGSALIGSWLVRTQQFEMLVEFSADGCFTRTSRNAQQSDTAKGFWKMNGAVLEMKGDGTNAPETFTVKMPDARTLEIWRDAESGLRLMRQGDAGVALPETRAADSGARPQTAANRQGTPVPEPTGGTGGRPSCPGGWAEFQHPLIGIQAYVPPEYWVRLRGGMMLTVEKQDSPGTMAFMMPFRPKGGVGAGDIARQFARFVAESESRFKAEAVGQPAPDRAVMQFTSVNAGRPVEGRYCAVLGAGGTMAFVIGVSAPQGRLGAEMPTLEKIARGFGFTPPRGRWIDYQSPAGGFTMTMPQGWQVQSNDGQTSKDNIDWVAFDPKKPLSRTFQWCPRFCSPAFLQDPLHAIRGYQAAQFQNHQQVVTASLGQISKNVKLAKMEVNQQLTKLFQALIQQTSQMLGAVAGARMDVVVYDCLARAEVEGRQATVAFVTCIQTLSMSGGISGQLIDLSVTLRGWCAEPNQFVLDSPVLEKVCSSMQLSAAFLRNVMKGNDQAVNKIRETYAYMNKVDDQIRDSHWKTMDAIAEMNYDNLRDHGGYVNENTGRIEQISPEKVVKNSRGEFVSREEVERGVSPESATVLRDAFSNDYMKGVYGRIGF